MPTTAAEEEEEKKKMISYPTNIVFHPIILYHFYSTLLYFITPGATILGPRAGAGQPRLSVPPAATGPGLAGAGGGGEVRLKHTHICIYIYAHSYMYLIDRWINQGANKQINIYIYMYVCEYTYIRTHVYVYTHVFLRQVAMCICIPGPQKYAK